MKGWAIAIIILVLVAIGGGTYLATRPAPPSSYEIPAETTTPAPTASDVQVASPAAGSIVKSPLTVTGKAKGTWYFEASFPVKVLDAAGKVIGQAPAQAQGDWMTAGFVPFKATVSFSTSTATGFIVLEKDNPSGLPQNAAELRMPVRFE
ncbi:Gmad2 immunoglobulin-like domain-containing protein [Candidatus Parcubacteria bacterium]|nr:Gmad2 immunoglobulin-like domain-containing protein [Candidatus Parcubacteria bacterium]